MTGIDFLYAHLGIGLLPEFNTAPRTSDQFCACCGRPNREWADPDRLVVGSSYGKEEIHCLACHTLFHPSFNRLGREGMRGENHTALKLGMLKGCGALVHPCGSVLYAPKKYFPKFQSAPNPLFEEIVDLGGKAIIHDVLARIAEIEPPYLFISNFGVKKNELVENLVVSESSAYINVCSEEGVFELPNVYGRFEQTLLRMDVKDRGEWLDVFKRSCFKRLTPDEVIRLNELTNAQENFVPVLQSLPVDPHIRLKLAQLVESA